MSQQSDDDGEIWPEGAPRNAWHSFDAAPWLHPWLTRSNLEAMRQASTAWRAEARAAVKRSCRAPSRFAFVGNIANGMYVRARSLVHRNVNIDVFGLYGDDSVFSDPRWEEYDGTLPAEASYLAGDKAFLSGIQPNPSFEQFTVSSRFNTMTDADLPSYVRKQDFARYRSYFGHLPAIDRLQAYDALFVTQNAYLGYLSGRPYIATQMGGDIWLEASRDDALGRLQRTGFQQAACVLVSNPWAYAHARRYGLNNLVYLPLTLNEVDYSPGSGCSRAAWEASGGTFFVLTTARMDDYYKGSDLGIRGFAQFCAKYPGARLVIVGWGNDLDKTSARLARLGIADRTIFVPVSGKRRMVDYLRSADCLLDQFRLGYFGATALEGAACGLPIIMRVERAQYEALSRTGAPPFLNAESSNDVANALESLVRDADSRRATADLHRQWFLDNHSGSCWGEDYETMLGAVALGHRFSFETSPLNENLSAVERLYHAEQLAAAPEFPSYELPLENFADVRGHQNSYPEALELATRALWVSKEIEARLNSASDKAQQRLTQLDENLEETARRTSTEVQLRLNAASDEVQQRLAQLDKNLEETARRTSTEVQLRLNAASHEVQQRLAKLDKNLEETARRTSTEVHLRLNSASDEVQLRLTQLDKTIEETGNRATKETEDLLDKILHLREASVSLTETVARLSDELQRRPIRKSIEDFVAALLRFIKRRAAALARRSY